MAIETLTPYHRTGDGELAGYLRLSGDDAVAEPVSLLGHALGAPCSRSEAEAILAARGLAVLGDAYWARAPHPLTSNAIDLRRPEPDWGWRRFLVAELSQSTARLRLQFAAPEERGETVTVALPAADVLHVEPPDE